MVDAFEYNEECIQQEQQNRLLICGSVIILYTFMFYEKISIHETHMYRQNDHRST